MHTGQTYEAGKRGAIIKQTFAEIEVSPKILNILGYIII